MRCAISLALVFLVTCPAAAVAQDDYTLLKVFEYIPPGSYSPYPTPLQKGTDGNFYGHTGYGTFKVTPDGVYSEAGPGFFPRETLIDGGDGYFYSGLPRTNYVLKYDADGSATELYRFTDPSIGWLLSPVVQGTDGDLYGIAGFTEQPRIASSLFRLTKQGVFSVLHTFPLEDGPVTSLLGARDGSIYGTTSRSLFRAVNGIVTTAFGGIGTLSPYLGEGSDGSIYGGTAALALVFKFSPDQGAVTLWPLPEFLGVRGDQLAGSFLEGSDGNLYGTATRAIFSITPAGVVRILHDTLRSSPATWGTSRLGTNFSGVLEGTDGNLYGTALNSGPGGFGAVFRLNRRRAPCVSMTRFASYYSLFQALYLEGTVKTATPAFHAAWLFTPSGVTTLWAGVIPPIDPSFYFVLPSITVPENTPVGVLTVLVTAGLDVCSDWQAGVTGPDRVTPLTVRAPAVPRLP